MNWKFWKRKKEEPKRQPGPAPRMHSMGAGYVSNPDPLGMMNPLNPLSPFSPLNPLNWDSAREEERRQPSSEGYSYAPSWDSSQSYSSSDSSSSGSSSDSGSSSSSSDSGGSSSSSSD